MSTIKLWNLTTFYLVLTEYYLVCKYGNELIFYIIIELYRIWTNQICVQLTPTRIFNEIFTQFCQLKCYEINLDQILK